ncbi:MAG: oligoribonuclease [Deltaproteobacteria bacterium]|jgi:oligoribonuclease|nr:oligoribonuclease [Deltaproteobacteria bacterium]MBW2533945.1 oligoribonuclease [Deltaproteobacteria bacterium]
MASDTNLVWVDLEMTGLDPDRCTIVEIATIITSPELEVVAEGPCLVIHQPDEVLDQMVEEVRDLHTRSGLLEQIRASSLSLAEAEQRTLAFVREHCREGKSPLCGNSIWKDRQFIEKYMVSFARFLHYRVVDVSSIKELARRWYGERGKSPEKAEQHRALDDIRESIAELRWYREQLFVDAAALRSS